jgi:hypothetical protein
MQQKRREYMRRLAITKRLIIGAPAALVLVIALMLWGGASTVAHAKPTPPPTVTCTLSGTVTSGNLMTINATPDSACGLSAGDCGGAVGSNPDFHCFGPTSCSAYKTVTVDLTATGSAMQATSGCFTAPYTAKVEGTCTTSSTCGATKHGNPSGSLGCIVAWPNGATGTFTADCSIP